MKISNLRLVVLTALCATVTACNSNESRAKNVVRANISDPDSAKFGAFVEVDSKKRDWACLEVNYKGPGGGYVGSSAARLMKPAGGTGWKFEGIAGTQEQCVQMIHEMQPYEGGAS